jgi:hypothetical protein
MPKLAPPCPPLQIPDSPRGVVMMIHGCKSSGYNWFPQSDACRECRGLPEQLSHTLQALNRGYAGGWVGGWVGILLASSIPASHAQLACPARSLLCADPPHHPPAACRPAPACSDCHLLWGPRHGLLVMVG